MEDDDVLVLPPMPADPLFVEAVDDAVSGSVDHPEAQPERPLQGGSRDFASLYIRHRSSFALHARRFLNDPRDVDEEKLLGQREVFLQEPVPKERARPVGQQPVVGVEADGPNAVAGEANRLQLLLGRTRP